MEEDIKINDKPSDEEDIALMNDGEANYELVTINGKAESEKKLINDKSGEQEPDIILDYKAEDQKPDITLDDKPNDKEPVILTEGTIKDEKTESEKKLINDKSGEQEPDIILDYKAEDQKPDIILDDKAEDQEPVILTEGTIKDEDYVITTDNILTVEEEYADLVKYGSDVQEVVFTFNSKPEDKENIIQIIKRTIEEPVVAEDSVVTDDVARASIDAELESEYTIDVLNYVEKRDSKFSEDIASEKMDKNEKFYKILHEDFMDPFKCYIKTDSLIELDETARKGALKKISLPILMRNEVVLHNKPNDCWVIIHNVVFDLTPLIKEYSSKRKYKLVKPIIAHAGKDISHWFHHRKKDILHFIHPITGVNVPYTPHGRLPDVGLQIPSTKWKPITHIPWWQNQKYVVGVLTKQSRPIRILNTLNNCEVLLNVCCEDTLNKIQERYLAFNKHSQSYTWKYEKKILDMNLTLDENGIYDERSSFTKFGLLTDLYIPCILLYFNDDLTEY